MSVWSRGNLLEPNPNDRLRQCCSFCNWAAIKLKVKLEGLFRASVCFGSRPWEALYYESFVENDIGVAEVVLVPCLAMITHRSMIALQLDRSLPTPKEFVGHVSPLNLLASYKKHHPTSCGQRKYSGLSPEEYELWQNAPKRIAAKRLGSCVHH